MCITRPSSMIIPIRLYVTVNLEKHGNTRGQPDELDENLQSINSFIMMKMTQFFDHRKGLMWEKNVVIGNRDVFNEMHDANQIFSFLMAFPNRSVVRPNGVGIWIKKE
ncbi:hypothetical protein BDA99DRAFT_543196 [Phascolomyces articulosus]|uniref:Uncharacterized protein n=1 Tax=Phascolomyces articulosus TaxID=60185 RepID=A0AAD5JXM8_9FUNG|nr:hypothetical protein BDA99DRAFT_543196 [Phascolomyces articulosus]